MFSHTDARIVKMWLRGVSVRSIARKIGRPDDIARVLEAINRHKNVQETPETLADLFKKLWTESEKKDRENNED